MKNVLIISFHFSNNEIIGSHRSQGLAKCIHQFGWHPIVVTKKTDNPLVGKQYDLVEVSFESKAIVWKGLLGWEGDKTIREQKGTPVLKHKQALFDKTLALFADVAFYPDGMGAWIDNAVKEINKSIDFRKIDAMISTSSPVSDHFIAQKIKRKYGIPWIADFRDLWSQNHYRRSMVKDILNLVSEKIIISDADMLTTVSEPLANKLRAFHNGKKVASILNGYDPDDLNLGASLDNRFRLVHTGSLYRGRRDPEPLFCAIHELIAEGKILRDHVVIDFYGPIEDWLSEDARKYGLNDVVKIHGPISRRDVLLEQRKAQILLLLTWNNQGESGVYTGKIFEYVAAKRPILHIGSTEGVASNLLVSYNIGKNASTVNEIKRVVLDYYSEFTSKGQVQYCGSGSTIQQLSQTRMAQEFSESLNIITQGQPKFQ